MQYFGHSYCDRIEMLNRIWAKTGAPALRDYEVTVFRDIPQQESDLMQNIPFLREPLSLEDTLRVLPFIDDPKAAAAAKMAEMKEMAKEGMVAVTGAKQPGEGEARQKK